ncbi:non-toxic nonhemagglutinin NTNH [Clostridium botulinum]|uniref:Nontoxic-nonhaemagglutinin n=3 Tax=Clostridium botulinum TaxID=1491 RepID=O69276_CLOBO|nr:non-toxic nonhemagglutinin NTNH [Clostridium botulinum]APC78469.1 nontoxic nonhemagglutinin protein [Clostridium botulinum]APC85053.1 nontoxic nonhemagglutinin protein [Clostridium botulinum]AXG95868.1 peptidase M27 [Clostridium botulinum]EDT82317.1 botulinum neurotoxin type E, nontoxic component [Clostridium botulinum NCTC 2916]MBN3409644.1 peptidase M27 [Clostridium botulinum]
MKINNNFNIDSPVDNKDVAIVRGRKTDIFLKVFQVAPNIWVAPERYYGESLNINEDQKSNGGIYDSNFLLTNDEKDEFLQATVKILQRINNNVIGAKLLSLISTAIPFPYEYRAEDYRQTNYLSSKDNQHYYTANLVIFGPGTNIVENNVVYYKKEDSKNGMGTMSEIWFQPFLTYKYDQFYVDPALELIKCLIKSLYYLYGIKPNDDLSIPYRLRSEFNSLEYSELDMVDFLISGGTDYKLLNTNPYWFTDNYFINAPKNFEKYKNDYETKIKNNNDIANSIKLYLEQKFKTNVQDIWELNLSYFSTEFEIMMPEIFNNALNHYHRKEYYVIDYFKNYNINGFINGQIKTILPLSKYNKNIINKPELIVNLINENNSVLMKSNIYGDGLKDTIGNFYAVYKIPYNIGDEYHINSSDSCLDNVDIKEIDNIPPINDADIYPYRKNCDPFTPVYNITETKEINTTIPFPVNYLQAQVTNSNDINLSSDFLKVISSKDRSLVYSFLDNTIDYLDSIKYDGPIDTDKKYYLWLKEIFRNYSFDITATQEINTDCGINKVVTWFGKALNILNTSDSFVEEFQNLGPISLINKKENLSMPKIEIDEIPNSMLNLSFKDLSENLFNIFSKNNSYFEKIYYDFLDQWWTQYYSQYFDLICMAKRSVLAQESLIKKIIQKKLSYLIGNSNISSDNLALMNLTTTNTLRDISNESQIAMNNVNNFLNNVAICVFQTNIYPKFISFMEQCINNINKNTREFIQKCTNITENEKLQLINQNIFSSLDFDFLNIENLKSLFNSETGLLIKEETSPYELVLYAFQEPGNNAIGDASGKNTSIEYSKDIGLVYGINSDALYLNGSNQSISFSNDFFENGLTNSFSIYFWLRNLGKDTIKSKLIGSKEDNCGWEIYFQDTGLVFNMIDSNGNEKNIYLSDVSNNSWHYITISVDRLKEQLLIFIDDNLVANESIKEILNIYSSNTISLVNENNPIYVEGLSILNKPTTSQEVLSNYFKVLNNSYIRDSSEERLEYNKTYQLYNYVFSENPIYEIKQNNNIYLTINNTNNLNLQVSKFKLLSINPNKQYVQKLDEVIISVLDNMEKYIDISEDNRLQLIDNKNNAKKMIISNDIFISNCLIISYNGKYICLSMKDENHNWMICNNDMSKYLYLWSFK